MAGPLAPKVPDAPERIVNTVCVDDRLLGSVETWFGEQSPLLTRGGVSARLRPTSSGLQKNNVAIDFESDARIVQIVVWDSGEAEVIQAERFTDNAPLVHIVSLSVPAEVNDLLDFALESISRK